MKKNLLIILGIVAIIALSSAVTYAVTSGAFNHKMEKPSDYKIGVSYDKAMNSEKPIIALFYVDWCAYCMRFMPKYKDIEAAYKSKYNLVMINVEDPENKEVVDSYKISSFPTLYLIDPKYDNRVHISSTMMASKETLTGEFDRFLRIRKLLDNGEKCISK